MSAFPHKHLSAAEMRAAFEQRLRAVEEQELNEFLGAHSLPDETERKQSAKRLKDLGKVKRGLEELFAAWQGANPEEE